MPRQVPQPRSQPFVLSTIGEVAKRSGIGVETIRFYEREGVIPPPLRTESGYRQYGVDIFKRLHFIKRAQGLGFSLKEIKQLIALRVTPKSNCAEVKRRALVKLDKINEKIADLQRMRGVLQKRSDGSLCGKPPNRRLPDLK